MRFFGAALHRMVRAGRLARRRLHDARVRQRLRMSRLVRAERGEEDGLPVFEREPKPEERPTPGAQWDERAGAWIEWDADRGAWVEVG